MSIKRISLGIILSIGLSKSIQSQTITHYTSSNTSGGIGSDWVISLAPGNNNDLLVGSGGGLGILSTSSNTWTTLGSPTIIRSCYFNSTTNNIWEGTIYGIAKYTGTVSTQYNTASGLAADDTQSMSKDASGNLWFGAYGGLTKYNGSTFTKYYTTDGMIGNSVHSVKTQSNTVWIGTSDGLSKLVGSSFTNYTVADGLPDNDIKDIYVDGTTIWLATAGGISKYNGSTFTNYTASNSSLISDYVTCITKDTYGSIWVGTNAGVNCFDGTYWKSYTTVSGLASNDIRDILYFKNCIWIGTGGGGMDKLSVAPNLEVSGNNTIIFYNDMTPITGNNTDMGATDVATGAITKTYRFANIGNAPVILGSPTVVFSGPAASDFSLSATTPTTLHAGYSYSFSITFNPSALGVRTTTVTVANNMPTQSPYVFAMQGTGNNSTGIFDHQAEENSLVMYPNPASDHISFKTNEVIQKIDLYDSYGRLVMNYKEVSEKIELPKTVSGIYFLHISIKDKIISKKIIIQ